MRKKNFCSICRLINVSQTLTDGMHYTTTIAIQRSDNRRTVHICSHGSFSSVNLNPYSFFLVTFNPSVLCTFITALCKQQQFLSVARMQADVSDVTGEFQRRYAGAASSLRHLSGHLTCRQQAIQVRLSPIIVDRRR